jgi:hypothetical protein
VDGGFHDAERRVKKSQERQRWDEVNAHSLSLGLSKKKSGFLVLNPPAQFILVGMALTSSRRIIHAFV